MPSRRANAQPDWCYVGAVVRLTHDWDSISYATGTFRATIPTGTIGVVVIDDSDNIPCIRFFGHSETYYVHVSFLEPVND